MTPERQRQTNPSYLGTIERLIRENLFPEQGFPTMPYTTSGDAMLQVIEKTVSRVILSRVWRNWEERWVWSCSVEGAFGYAEADTAPLAVCLAALKALNIEIPAEEEATTDA